MPQEVSFIHSSSVSNLKGPNWHWKARKVHLFNVAISERGTMISGRSKSLRLQGHLTSCFSCGCHQGLWQQEIQGEILTSLLSTGRQSNLELLFKCVWFSFHHADPRSELKFSHWTPDTLTRWVILPVLVAFLIMSQLLFTFPWQICSHWQHRWDF